jgi:predicted transcriptional regulator
MRSTLQIAEVELSDDRVQSPVAVLDCLAERDIIEAMSDECSRKILGSIIERAKPIDLISSESGIPISTSYRRVRKLLEMGLVITERILVSSDGKREAIYRSTLRGAKIEFESGKFRALGALNDEIPDISFRMWQFAQSRGNPLR